MADDWQTFLNTHNIREEGAPASKGKVGTWEDLTKAKIAPPTTMEKYVEGPVLGALQGGAELGYGIQDLLRRGANIIPGVNLPKGPAPQAFGLTPRTQQLEHTLPAEIAKYGTEAVGTAIPGEGFVRGAEMAPALARMLGYGATAAATTPGGIGQRALAGGIAGAAGLIPEAKGLAEKFMPKRYARHILDTLGEGKGLEENAKDVASSIKKAYGEKTLEDAKNYGKILDKVGNHDIYKYRLPLRGYKGVDADLLKKAPGKIESANADFLKDPTFENAHNLQSTIGHETYEPLKNKKNLSLQDRKILEKLADNRDDIITDMHKYLNRADRTGKLSDEYNDAADFHRDEVMPYRSNTPIRMIAKGEITNPRSLSTIFKSPEEDTIKVLKDLPIKSQDKIVYNELGKLRGSLTPQKLLDQFDKLDTKGLDTYASDSLRDQMQTLAKRNMLLKGGAGLAGLLGLEEAGRYGYKKLREKL